MVDSEAGRDVASWLTEARARQQLISANMPEGVDPRTLTLVSKTPYVAMCFREAQFCRAEEFARAACDMFERDDVVVGIANTRAMLESVVAIWFLNEKLKRQIANGLEPDIHQQMVQLLMGFRSETTFPPAINILTMIEKFNKEVPGFREQYDRLSEFAHPNYSGALGAFGVRDEVVPIAWFRKGDRTNKDPAKRIGLGNLVPGLAILEIVYNETADLMPRFCQLFEPQTS